jgi:hypothetical protein
MKRIFTIMAALGLAFAATAIVLSPAEARGYHRHHHYGACDGFHRCRCGVTQANHFGLPYLYHGYNLKEAIEWVRAFPHTSVHVGAVGYQHSGGRTGHVFRVVGYSGGCTARVSDDAGTYDRNICRRHTTFVAVNGETNYRNYRHRHHRRYTVTLHARRHHYRHYVHTYRRELAASW